MALDRGYTVDRFEAVRPIVCALITLAIVLITLPFTAMSFAGAAIAVAIWGIAGLALFAPQQYRILGLAPTIPTIIIALNSSMTYLGIAAGSGVGGIVLAHASVLALCFVGATFALAALLVLSLSVRLSHVHQPENKGSCGKTTCAANLLDTPSPETIQNRVLN